MSSLDKVISWIDETREQSIEKLARLISQPSVSSTGEGVEECAQLLVEMLTEVGLDAKVMPTKGLPAVYAERIAPGTPTVIFYGHYDVQPVGDLSLWETPPFEPDIRNGRMYGRGTGDNKGQLLTHIIAVDAFLKTYGELPCSVKFLLDGEEESGSPNLGDFVEENKELLKADVCYFADGPIHYSGRPQVVFGCRGIIDVEIVLDENIRDCHSGHYGALIPNPAWRLVHLLKTMKDAGGKVLVEGFYDKVRPITPAEEEVLKHIPFDVESYFEGVRYPGTGPEWDRIEALKAHMFQPTMTITGLGSGYTGEGVATIVPAKAVCKIDMRLVADQDPDEIFELIEKHVKKHLPEAKVSGHGKMYPSRTELELPISQAIIGAVKRAWGVDPVVVPSSGASCPEYVFTQILEMPTISVPYANPDENNHAPNENFDLDLFIQGIKTTAHVIDTIAKHEEW
ncbi:MAG: M20/M25/M40 family metallo-hydrolase [Bacillota bacterium]|mgnify:FL=1|nr:M20/M25/M40 family metallo-hydrolase [Bacillota bacterium]HOP71443.1 M20/M25/M40 family metallo-hydrolase [Bacillota bacterium]HPT36279.1 M20/M25/M40 family metallo-hydrolase [Bacillota bacterium]HPZ85964.1 M20/M25/M40 family metallo-hydrolase [Bacillota bacterium]HQD86327.1 M20/M25/M40 family metallo-hydrolase [Bacillota bacterium]